MNLARKAIIKDNYNIKTIMVNQWTVHLSAASHRKFSDKQVSMYRPKNIFLSKQPKHHWYCINSCHVTYHFHSDISKIQTYKLYSLPIFAADSSCYENIKSIATKFPYRSLTIKTASWSTGTSKLTQSDTFWIYKIHSMQLLNSIKECNCNC